MAALTSKPGIPLKSLALPALLLAALAGTLAIKADLIGLAATGPVLDEPLTVEIAPRRFEYRDSGEFFRNGFAVDGPVKSVTMRRLLTIMKYQVTAADYGRCVADGVCPAAEPGFAPYDATTTPATGVSYDDAITYAGWLSARTGEVWGLPSDQDLAFAAGSRFPDDALGVDVNSTKPAVRPRAIRCRSRSAVSARTSTVLRISPAISGSGRRPATGASISTRPAPS
jgi:formylglycine-generating enzyme required for sulfatase activity